jgi:multiple sugar transport system permease protein
MALLQQKLKRFPRLLSRKYAPYIFISPFFIFFIVFGLFPTLFSFYLSFQEWRQAQGLGAMQWNGIENYTFTLTDPWFWQAFANTLILGVYGLAIQPFAIVLAFLIHQTLGRFKQFVLALYFLPYITSTVAIAIVFGMVFSKNAGLLNALLSLLNQIPLLNLVIANEPVDWLGKAATVKPSIALVLFWLYLGWNTILHITAIQAIPKELYEAAAIDGANVRQQFWRITLPLLRPTLFLTVTLTIIGQMQLFDVPYILTGEGGPGKAGLTVATYLYLTGFKWGEPGTAAAIAWLLFIFIVVFNVINNYIFKGEGRARG